MKKTKDGRIIDKRVKISKGVINKIILEVKNKQKIDCKRLAKKLNISESSLREWKKGKTTIPLVLFKKLLKKSKTKWKYIENKIEILNPYWGQKIGQKSKFENQTKIPKIDEDFAEFYGILLGDGCIYSNLSGFCISGNNILDKNYIEVYIRNLIEKLFNVKPNIYRSIKENSIRCVVYNKKIVDFLINLGFPLGYKKNKNNTKIPKEFFRKDNLLKACIRGIQDTDGSIYPQKNSKVILDISITSESLLESVTEACKKIGFPINNTKNRLYLCGEKPILSFFYVIGSSNHKHIIKYKIFLNTKKMPLSRETENLLKVENKLLEMKLPYHGPVV